MNWKNLVSLLVAIVMGLAALWIGRNIILGKQVVTKEDGDFVSVIVANKDLEPGHLIAAEALGHVDREAIATPLALGEEVSRMLVAMQRALESKGDAEKR